MAKIMLDKERELTLTLRTLRVLKNDPKTKMTMEQIAGMFAKFGDGEARERGEHLDMLPVLVWAMLAEEPDFAALSPETIELMIKLPIMPGILNAITTTIVDDTPEASGEERPLAVSRSIS